MTYDMYCTKCGCSVERACGCARGCLLHPTSVTVPTRMRDFLTDSSIWDEPKERHGYGDAGAASHRHTSSDRHPGGWCAA